MVQNIRQVTPDSVWADAAKLRAANDAPPRKATRRRVKDFGLCVMAVLLAKEAANQQEVSDMDTFKVSPPPSHPSSPAHRIDRAKS